MGYSLKNKPPKKTEKLIRITKSKRQGKKYSAFVKNLKTKKVRIIHFGATGYQQFKDSTKLKSFKSKNHGDSNRRRLYFTRHSGVPTKRAALLKEWRKSKGKYNPKILSHLFLW